MSERRLFDSVRGTQGDTMIRRDPDTQAFRDIEDALDIGVIVLDHKFVVRRWNRWIETHTGLTSREAIGVSILKLLPKLRGTRTHHAIRKVFRKANTAPNLPVELVENEGCPLACLPDPWGRDVQSSVRISSVPGASLSCLVQVIHSPQPTSYPDQQEDGREQALRIGINDKEFRMAFQPVVCPSGNVIGFEGLLRWSKSGLNISPNVFIPTAEETGLIHELGWEGLSLGLEALRLWVSQYQYEGFLSINVSPMQLGDAHFEKRLLSMMDRIGIDPEQIVLELTESAVVRDVVGVSRLMKRLRSRGLRIALDDFGSGYASLSQLYRLPVDILKLDRSFVSGIRNSRGRVLLCGVVELVSQLGCKLIIEGIETKNHFSFIKRSCTFLGLQGYYFHRPLDEEGASALVAHLSSPRVMKRMGLV
ncbi:MAG: EAL domain-containing protein [Myxococcales bacterium]|nr:EAL domain-containing protein [Myxococcales bacterium]